MTAAVGEYVVGRLAAMERTLDAVPQAPAREAMEQPTTNVVEAVEGEANADGITIPTIKKATGQEMEQFATMLDPPDTQINAIYDDLVCLGKVTPPVQGILLGAVRAMGAVEHPTIGKATWQEMLDPSDTQMNTIYDEFVCLVKVTPPAQGILPGAGGPREAVEQPTTEKMNAMYDDVTPLVQSILPCAVGVSRHAPTMVAPLRTPTTLAIPKVILNVRPIRRRFPMVAVRYLFLHDDIREGDTFDHYLRLEDGGIHETVEEVFDVMHRGMREEFKRYDHNLFDPTIEEEIPVEEMDRLCLFAEAVQPNWGDYMKQWIGCSKVVTVCNYNEHWGTVILDLKRQKIWLYDSMAWKFDYHHISNKRDVFLPMTRIVPQILKRIGYFERHRVKNPKFRQCELCFPSTKKNALSKWTMQIMVSTH
ncbi:hypothetical protein OROMI_002307 [Orobanche minor]